MRKKGPATLWKPYSLHNGEGGRWGSFITTHDLVSGRRRNWIYPSVHRTRLVSLSFSSLRFFLFSLLFDLPPWFLFGPSRPKAWPPDPPSLPGYPLPSFLLYPSAFSFMSFYLFRLFISGNFTLTNKVITTVHCELNNGH